MRRKRHENEGDSIEERAQKKMLELNEAGKFSDFTFTVDYEDFHVSKTVLCAVSPYFEKKFEAEWKSKASVDLGYEHDTAPFWVMIEYIYTYTSEELTRWAEIYDPVQVVEWYFEVYETAEKYEIPGLKEEVLERLPSAVKNLDCYLVGLFNLVTRQYVSDSEWGKVFLAAVADNAHNMEAFKDIKTLKELLPRIPHFAGDLIFELIKRRI